MRRRNGGHDYIQLLPRRNRVWFLILHPLVFEQLPPNQHVRLTARGFTNLRGGHRRLRSCFSATAVTTERVARRAKHPEGAPRKPAVRRRAGLGVQAKCTKVQPWSSLAFMAFVFVAPIPDSGPATDGRAEHRSLFKETPAKLII